MATQKPDAYDGLMLRQTLENERPGYPHLAARYKVSRSTVNSVIVESNWSHYFWAGACYEVGAGVMNNNDPLFS